MNFNADSFVHDANSTFLTHQQHQRYGQYLVNYLSRYFPQIATQIPEEANCFYDNNKVPAFLGWIYTIN